MHNITMILSDEFSNCDLFAVSLVQVGGAIGFFQHLLPPSVSDEEHRWQLCSNSYDYVTTGPKRTGSCRKFTSVIYIHFFNA